METEQWREVTLYKPARMSGYKARICFSMNPPEIKASIDHRLVAYDRVITEEGTEWEIYHVENEGRWSYLSVRPYRQSPKAPMQSLQESIGEWAERTFPTHTKESIALHLLSEAAELCCVLGVPYPDMDYIVSKTNNSHAHLRGRDPSVEAADVTILALTLANHQKFSLAQAVLDKMAVNFKRKWKQDPDMLGLTRRYEDAGSD